MFAGSKLSDANLRWMRKVGMGFLLAGVFLPFDLLILAVILAAGLYICTSTGFYVRQRWTHDRWAG
jgi:hypothetical protein